MAKAKKTTHNKSWWRRVHSIVHADVFKSVAIASLLLNVLFLVSVFVFTSTDTFDRRFYNMSREKYCKNYEGVIERAKELNDEQKALDEWRITCVSSEFKPFYQEAVEKFRARNNEKLE